MSTELTITETIKGTLAKKGVTASDVFKAVHTATIAPPVQVESPLPKSVALAPEDEQSLKALPGLLSDLELPDTRRELTEPEQEALIDVTADVKAVKAAVIKAETQLKTVAFNHFDAVARHNGWVNENTPRTKEGWLVIDDRDSLSVSTSTKKLTREVTPGSVTLTADALTVLETEGVIDHATYLALTMPVRVIDEDAVLAALKKDPGLAEVLAKAATVAPPKASFNLRSNK